MRVLWTLFKIIIGLAIAIPVGILALALTVGVVGTLVGLAIVALRLACVGFVAYGLYRLGRRLFAPAAPAPRVHDLPPADAYGDAYYHAAMRELDSELRGAGRR
jgi:hypothetical protein